MVDAIRRLAHPTNVTTLCSLLGLCNLLRRFVTNLPRFVALPNKKLSKTSTTELWRIFRRRDKTPEEAESKVGGTALFALSKGEYTVDAEEWDTNLDVSFSENNLKVPTVQSDVGPLAQRLWAPITPIIEVVWMWLGSDVAAALLAWMSVQFQTEQIPPESWGTGHYNGMSSN